MALLKLHEEVALFWYKKVIIQCHSSYHKHVIESFETFNLVKTPQFGRAARKP